MGARPEFKGLGLQRDIVGIFKEVTGDLLISVLCSD